MIAPLIVALLLGQTPVDTVSYASPAPVLYAPFDSYGPMFIEDANTVAHVYWQDGVLVDTKGNSWTQNGTVPQFVDSPLFPDGYTTSNNLRYGAGPFADANRYDLGTGSDVLDFAGDFTICTIWIPNFQNDGMFVSNGLLNTDGWVWQNTAARQARMTIYWAGGSATASTSNQPIYGSMNIACGGRNGLTAVAKLNNGPMASGAVTTITPATTRAARIGSYNGGGALNPESIYEIWASTDTPTDASMRALITAASLALRTGSGPAFTDTGTTVAHVTWGASGLADSKGNVWTQVGTVPLLQSPQNATGIASVSRKGAGPYSTTDYYSLGSGSDVFDFAGGTGTICITFFASGFAPTNYVLGNTSDGATNGYELNINGGNGVSHFVVWGIGDTTPSSGQGVPMGGVSVACMGVSGNTMYYKFNNSPTATITAGAYVPPTGGAMQLGRSFAGAAPASAIYEVWATTTAPSSTLFDSYVNRVIGLNLPSGQTLTTSRTMTAGFTWSTNLTNGRLWNWDLGVPRFDQNGLLIESARTNSVLRSEQSCVANAVFAPWTLGSGTPTCTSDASVAPKGGIQQVTADRWTSTVNTDLITQPVTTASAASFAVSGFFARTTSGIVTLRGTCTASTASACACYTSDGRFCSATAAGADCTVTSTANLIWHRLMGSFNCAASITNPSLSFAPGQIGVSTGTADVWGLQLEGTGASSLPPSSYMQTINVANVRSGDLITTTYPSGAVAPKWCASMVAQPMYRAWGNGGALRLLSAGNETASGTSSFRLYQATATTFTLDIYDSGGVLRSRTSGAHSFGQGAPGHIAFNLTTGSPADINYRLAHALTNGAASGTGTGTLVTPPTLRFGEAGNTQDSQWSGWLRDLRLGVGDICTGGSIYPVLFDDDANTISHVIFRNGALIDLKGTTWTKTGSPGITDTFPPSGTSWTDSAYYSAPAGSINPTTTPFTACFAVKEHGSGVNNPGILDMKNAGNSNGVRFSMGSVGPAWAQIEVGGVTTASPSPLINRGEIGVWCAGNNGSQNLVKMNNTATTVANATFTADASLSPFIGRSQTNDSRAFSNGLIYEIWLTRTTPTDALFAAKIKTALDRMQYTPAP